MESTWKSILLSLPSRENIDAMLNQKFEQQAVKIEWTLMREIQSLKDTVGILTNKVEYLEGELSKIQQKGVPGGAS